MNALPVAMIATAALLLPAFVGTAQAKVKCKTGLTNIYKNKAVVAKVITNWCYNGKSVVSRQSIPSDHVRNAAFVAGFREAQEG